MGAPLTELQFVTGVDRIPRSLATKDRVDCLALGFSFTSGRRSRNSHRAR